MYIFCNIKICVNCNFNDNRVICYIISKDYDLAMPKLLKKLGGHRLRLQRSYPDDLPKSEKIGLCSKANTASVCKPKNIVIKSLK